MDKSTVAAAGKKENSKQRKAQEKAEKVAKAGTTTPQAAKPVKDGALPKMPKLPGGKKFRKPKEQHPCACGCNTPTTGRWAPGHDARANGWAIRIERELLTLKDVPENERAGAKLMLAERKEKGIKPGAPMRVVKGGVAKREEEAAAAEAVNG